MVALLGGLQNSLPVGLFARELRNTKRGAIKLQRNYKGITQFRVALGTRWPAWWLGGLGESSQTKPPAFGNVANNVFRPLRKYC